MSASTAQLTWRLASAISTKFIRNFLLGQIHSDFELLRKQLLGLRKWCALAVSWEGATGNRGSRAEGVCSCSGPSGAGMGCPALPSLPGEPLEAGPSNGWGSSASNYTHPNKTAALGPLLLGSAGDQQVDLK